MRIASYEDIVQIASVCRTFSGRRYSRLQASRLVGHGLKFAVEFKESNRWRPAYNGAVCRWTDSGGHPFGKAYATLEKALQCRKRGTRSRIIVVKSRPDNYGNAVPVEFRSM
jgi:hypothetical protein